MHPKTHRFLVEHPTTHRFIIGLCWALCWPCGLRTLHKERKESQERQQVRAPKWHVEPPLPLPPRKRALTLPLEPTSSRRLPVTEQLSSSFFTGPPLELRLIDARNCGTAMRVALSDSLIATIKRQWLLELVNYTIGWLVENG